MMIAMFGFLPKYVEDSLFNMLVYNLFPVEIKYDANGPLVRHLFLFLRCPKTDFVPQFVCDIRNLLGPRRGITRRSLYCFYFYWEDILHFCWRMIMNHLQWQGMHLYWMLDGSRTMP